MPDALSREGGDEVVEKALKLQKKVNADEEAVVRTDCIGCGWDRKTAMEAGCEVQGRASLQTIFYRQPARVPCEPCRMRGRCTRS
mmetsp:Transcript_23477/g.69165  ORF Transcript_23477/g.69165 Transcript_23477/m.69165 type:complete len:85 (-) Transcript_23477:153-407(-)